MLTLLILYGGVYSLFYSFSYLFYPRSILLFLRTLAAKHCSSKTTSAWQNGGRPPRTGGACSADLRGRAGYAYRLSNAHSAWQARRGCVPPLYFGAKLFLRGRAAKHGLASRTGGLNPTLFPTTGGTHGRVGGGKLLLKCYLPCVGCDSPWLPLWGTAETVPSRAGGNHRSSKANCLAKLNLIINSFLPRFWEKNFSFPTPSTFEAEHQFRIFLPKVLH